MSMALTAPPTRKRFLIDAPRDKCVHFREINGIAAAFHYLQKNYNPTASFFLWPSTGKYRYSVDNPTP